MSEEKDKKKEENEFIDELFKDYMKNYENCEYYSFSLNLSLVMHKDLDLGTCSHPKNKFKDCNFNKCPLYQSKYFEKFKVYYYIEFVSNEEGLKDGED